jgi:hypothetical protein
MVGVAAVDGDRAGCNDIDHISGMADGCYRQFDPSFDLFFFRLVIGRSRLQIAAADETVYCYKKLFYDGDSESTRGKDPAGSQAGSGNQVVCSSGRKWEGA